MYMSAVEFMFYRQVHKFFQAMLMEHVPELLPKVVANSIFDTPEISATVAEPSDTAAIGDTAKPQPSETDAVIVCDTWATLWAPVGIGMVWITVGAAIVSFIPIPLCFQSPVPWPVFVSEPYFFSDLCLSNQVCIWILEQYW